MKNLNVKVQNSVLENLRIVQKYYGARLGVSFNQAEALSKLLDETANLIIDATYPGGELALKQQAFEMHEKDDERSKHE